MGKIENDLMLYLTRKGLKPEMDKEGDIIIFYRNATFLIICSETDFCISLPGIATIQSKREYSKACVAANAVNSSSKYVKCIVAGDSVMLCSVHLAISLPEYNDVLFKLLDALLNAQGVFYSMR